MKFAAILFLLAFATISAAAQIDASAEEQIFSSLNGERTSRGLAPLRQNPKLKSAAEAHSEIMAREHAISHKFDDEADPTARIVASGVHVEATGENVAISADATRAHAALMKSPPHRANILDPKFTEVGIGVVKDGNTIYVTQDFARTVPEYSVTEAERRIAQFVADERRRGGGKPLSLLQRPELRKQACMMAKEGMVSMAKVRTLPNVSTTVVFTASDLSGAPEPVERLKNAPGTALAVGVCYAASPKVGIPQYWVAIVTYF